MKNREEELLARLALAVSDSIIDNSVGGWEYALFLANDTPQWGGTLHFLNDESENLSADCWSPEVEKLLNLIFSNTQLTTIAMKFDITGTVSFIPNLTFNEDTFLNEH